ncbi:MAG: 5-oxoprolinase subunit PxpB [Thiolinea sp.]
MRIAVAGENALIIYFGEQTNPQVSAQVQQATQLLEAALGEHLIDMVPSYASLLVIYNPLSCDHLHVQHVIRRQLQGQLSTGSDSTPAAQTVTLPVYYSTESGPDLEALSERAGLSVDEVIELHQGTAYHVYAIGFAPGFAYLGEVDERIAAPRLATPRLKVPRGAVAIADRQTAVYPAVSPGGWNLIGLCPTRMFNPDATPTMPVTVGDQVRFRAIGREEFLQLGGELP